MVCPLLQTVQYGDFPLIYDSCFCNVTSLPDCFLRPLPLFSDLSLPFLPQQHTPDPHRSTPVSFFSPYLPPCYNLPPALGTKQRASLLIVSEMVGIFQATSEDLWRGSIYGSWGTVLVIVFISICHLFCSKKNVCSLLSRLRTSSVVADRHISNISPSCPPQLR